MHYSNKENDPAGYPSADKCAVRARGKGYSEVEVLELETNEDDIKWNFSQGTALSNQITRLANGHEDLELSFLTRETIDFLVSQLQLLANISRTGHDDMQKEEISSMLDRLIKILGMHLYKVLFKGRIQDKLEAALNRGDLDLLRVELELEQNRKLASWPWEYLYRPLDEANGDGEFLARSTQLVLNRRLYVDRPIGTPQPVKVLLVVSRPQTEDLGEVQCEPVLSEIRKLQKKNVVELHDLVEMVEFSGTYQPTVTRQKFGRAIIEFSPHIIHFIGHGRWTHEGGQVAFVKGGGEPDWVNDEEVANQVARCKDLKLVFLQACESARVAPPYGMSMAMRLAHRNIPAVVAMQDEVENETASTFACSFYEALARGLSVDQAVKEGREAVNNLGYLHHAFGVPVLYLSSYESLIIQEKTPDPQASDLLRDPSSRFSCPQCNTVVAGASKVCSECGLHFYCRFCNARLDNPQGKFCNDCGERIRCERCGKNYRDNAENPLCQMCKSHIGAAESGENGV